MYAELEAQKKVRDQNTRKVDNMVKEVQQKL